MNRKNNDGDISADELLRRLRENLDMTDPDMVDIQMPDEPDEIAEEKIAAEDIVRMRSLRKAGLEDVVREEETVPEEPVDEPVGEAVEAVPEEPVVEIPAEAEEIIPEIPVEEIGARIAAIVPEEPVELYEPFGDEDDGDDGYVEAAFDEEAPDRYSDVGFADEAAYTPEPFDPAPAKNAEAAPDEAVTAEFDKQEEPADTAEFDKQEEPVDTAEFDKQEEPADTAEFESQDNAAEPLEQAFADALAAPVKIETPTTKEIDLTEAVEVGEPEGPITDEAVDGLMKKYLTEGEYEDVKRRRSADSDIARHLAEAEEYVSSIENAKAADAPRVPLTETEKAVQQVTGFETGNDLDEVDVNLMIAFGMEKELTEKLGEQNVQTVQEAMDIDAQQLDFSRGEKISTELPDDMEFISQSQIKDVFKVYKRKQRRIILRFFGAALLTLAIFIFENYTAFGGSFSGTWLDPNIFPTVRSMVSLQLCFFVLAFAYQSLFAGMKSLFTFKPTPKSVFALMAVVTVIYHVALCFLYDGTQVIFCTFPLAVCALLSIISEYMALKRNVYSFNIVSSKRLKYVISEIPEGEDALERTAFDDYIDEESSVSRVAKTSFVDGFFRRTKESSRVVPGLRAILPLPLLIAIFIFLFSTFVRRDVYLGLTTAYISFMLAAPAAVLMVYAIPLSRASKIAYEQGSAIIGEDALDEYSDVAAISFDDKDVFPSSGVRIQSIKVYSNNRIDRVIYNVASLFKYLGGPLADVYSIATKDFECSDDVEIVDIADDGIEAVVSGKRIFLGRGNFIARCGFDPVVDMDDYAAEQNPGTSITYLVTNDEVAAKIYTQYSIDPGFISIAKQLYHAGMCLGVKTFDPGIDNEMLGRFVDLEKYPIKVIKCHSTQDRVPTEEKTDSGIVSKKNTRSLLKALALCENVNTSSRTGMIIVMASVLIALVISGFLTFKGISGHLHGIYIALYQLFWLLPTAIITRFSISR